MTKEIANPQKVIVFRNGVEIWVDSNRADAVMSLIENGSQFIRYDGCFLNKADLVGIFLPEHMEDMKRRKNGEWKCKDRGNWHDKGTKCDCAPVSEKERNDAQIAAVAACGECQAGYVFDKSKDAMVAHDCLTPFLYR